VAGTIALLTFPEVVMAFRLIYFSPGLISAKVHLSLSLSLNKITCLCVIVISEWWMGGKVERRGKR
jgi:hypothetical protein